MPAGISAFSLTKCVVVVDGWVDVHEVVEVLARREGRQHVVITGRDAAPELIEAADLVMRTTKIKHPMDAGQKGQRGIEW